jgi:ATP-binding cassette subfamily B protein
VQKADNILVLEHGRLVEQGKHAELVEMGGVYAGLAALQFNA